MIWFSNFKTRLIILGLIMFILGIGLTVSSISDIIKLNGYIPDFNSDSMTDIKKGDLVCGYVANIFGNYANETTTNTTMGIETSSHVSKEYFIMPLINDEDYDKELYITVSASKKADIDLLNAIMDDTYDFLDGNDNVNWHEMAFIGRVVELDPELNGYLVDWFEEAEFFDGSIQSHIVPFELSCYDPSNVYTSLIIGLVLIGICITVALVIWFKVFRPQKAADNSGYTAPMNTGDGFSETPASGNAFSEAPAAGTQPMPQVSQPVQPDDFFARPERPAGRSEAADAPQAPEPPKPEPVQQAAPIDHSAGINTEALDVEKALREQERSAAASYKPVDNNQGIDTHTLDTDKALHEQERAIAANQKPIGNDQGIETHTLDTDKALHEQERAIAANQKPIGNDHGIETESLDVDKALHEQEQAVSSNTKIPEDSGGIDTSALNTDSLDYFDRSGVEDNTDDIFDFSNDYDYGEVSADNIEIT